MLMIRNLLLAAALWLSAAGALQAQTGRAEGPYAVPTPEQAFVVGHFQIKRSPLRRLDEDRYGEELDLSERRPAVNLQKTVFDTKYGRPGAQVFGNFYHRGRFWVVRVPDRAVRNVYFQLSYFPPKVLNRYIAAHSLLRLELDQPVELVAPMPEVAELTALLRAAAADRPAMLPDPLPDSPENRVRNIAISAEAQWTKNDPHKRYDLKRGLLGAFVQVVRFESMQTRLEGFFDSGNPATQIKLELERPELGDAIFRESLRTSESDGLSKLYDTLWYNCTTLAFDIVERGTGRKDRRVDLIKAFMQKRVPVVAAEKLEQYGGLEARPMHTDQSLLEDAAAAYRLKVTEPGRAVCKPGMDPLNCSNLREVSKLLEAAGRV
jgi:hypothetical protein